MLPADSSAGVGVGFGVQGSAADGVFTQGTPDGDELVLIDGWGRDEDDPRSLGFDGWVGEDGVEVLGVGGERHVLFGLVVGETGVVGAEEDGLVDGRSRW